MFSKRLSELIRDDVQGVIDRKVQEDREIGFKQKLWPTRDGTEDRWITRGEMNWERRETGHRERIDRVRQF